MNEFEGHWLRKLSAGLRIKGSEGLFVDVIEKRKDMSTLEWTKFLMKNLQKDLDKSDLQDVMTACACHYPNENLTHLKNEFSRSGDIQAVHGKLQKQFEEFIRKYKKLDDKDIKFLIENGWGMAGILEEDRIIATKIPKQYHEYFSTENKREKAFYYCHCPRVREALKATEKPLDMDYCYCGAGFYKGIWEFILQRSVRVEVLDSVMNDAEFCRVAIYFKEKE